MTVFEQLKQILAERVLLLDGAMGTMIQKYNLTEQDYRGERFANHPYNLKGNNDILNITKPEIIEDIHRKYLEAGADIIETNTFNANRVSQKDYGTEDYVYEMNYKAAQIARRLADAFTAENPQKPRFVAGSLGPTNKTASLSPDVNDPAYRDVDFDYLKQVYKEQAQALLDGGADILLIETVFDTLNAKAALFAIDEIMETLGYRIPVMLSGTLSDASGRTLSGQTVEAFLASTSHIDLLSVGLNCSLGPEQLKPYVDRLAKEAPFFVSAHPNAGMPDEMGHYHQTPTIMAKYIKQYLADRSVNIIGGCCGTTPEHIREFEKLVVNAKPRKVPPKRHETVLSGLEPLRISKQMNFINIGERTNVAGSRRFARLIREEKFSEALQVARQQVEAGAQIIDVCMDDPMIDAPRAMRIFLNLLMSDPYVARVPIMVDSSNWQVILTALKTLQGKSIVNSISLQHGEEEFLRRAKIIKRFGAAVVAMCVDEHGQATSFDRKIAIAKRSYELLTKQVGFAPEDIIIDPVVLTIGTGIKEHANYAVDFIKAVEWIKQNLPYAKTIAGVSNLSFSFRGNNAIREALHSVFLYYAIKAGLDMGIVNPAMLTIYDEIDPQLRKLAEDLVLNRHPEATERLISFSQKHNLKAKSLSQPQTNEQWRNQSADKRLKYAIINGIDTYIEQDLTELLPHYQSALDIIETVLMDAMKYVGDLFGQGKMFLPQVIRSARVMRKAVDFLTPIIEKQNAEKKSSSRGKILLATVKGDVHDIGKNIASVVLSCNGFEVIDLGVMVPTQEIIQKAIQLKPDIIGLSGLITPSLEYMIEVAQELEKHGLNIPLMISGATTSKLHTAVKIAPHYSAPVIYVKDASQSVSIAAKLTDQKLSKQLAQEIKQEYEQIRRKYQQKHTQYVALNYAREHKFQIHWQNLQIHKPAFTGIKVFKNYPIAQIKKYIDWTYFFRSWGISGRFPEIFSNSDKGQQAYKIYNHALDFLKTIETHNLLQANAVIGIFPANSSGDDIVVFDPENSAEIGVIHTLRQQTVSEARDYFLALSDFIAPVDTGKNDYIGMFVATAGINLEQALKEIDDDYERLMLKILADRLVEAFAELLHLKVRKQLWGYAASENLTLQQLLREKYQGIRPAIGYPASPDHTEKKLVFDLLKATENTGVILTETYAMNPQASVCGYYIANPQSKYFMVGKILDDQLEDYAKRKNMTIEEMRFWLKPYLVQS